jgi:hypothetical protein
MYRVEALKLQVEQIMVKLQEVVSAREEVCIENKLKQEAIDNLSEILRKKEEVKILFK